MRISRLVSAYDLLVSACAAIVAVLILAAVLLVTADVIGRYFLSAPIGWVFETTEHILVCVPFLGMAWLVRRAKGVGHVRIEIVVQMLPAHWQERLDRFASAIGALACGFAFFYAVETTIDHYVRGIVTYGIYPIPKFLLIAVVAIGLGLTTIELLRLTFGATGRVRETS
jgi:TRAP-type C4-dicarboxylate transport system permease small subunit